MNSNNRIRLVVFDWAGTIVDHGCFAPVTPFVEALRRHKIEITIEQAREPMGLDKKDHLRALLALPGVAAQWSAAHGHRVTHSDVDRIYNEDVVPLAVEGVAAHSEIIDGLLEMAAELRRRDIKIGGTTGYFTAAADACLAAAEKQGYRPDFSVCASDVAQARPAPWMIFRNMEALGVYPPSAVLKVGDTVPDIDEGLAAGAWTAGVTATGNELGLTAAEFAALAPDDRTRRLAAAEAKLRDAGAQYIIESIRDVPALIDQIDAHVAAP